MDAKIIFEDVDKNWKQIFLKHKNELLYALQNVARNEFLPDQSMIFHFGRYAFDDIRVVILGQDPYPKDSQEPHGLAFSSTGVDCPTSLNRIFGALIQSGLIEEKPQHWDLESWARQGVLLLNTSLTVAKNKPNSHTKYWKAFMDKLINEISKRKSKLIFLLWGANAHKKADFIDSKKHKVLKWCHPVAMTNPSFSHCNHFKKTNELLNEPIHWDTNDYKNEIIFYTDGACKNNQDRKLANASYGITCSEFNLNIGFKLKNKMVRYAGENIMSRQTNIRAEGSAILYVLKYIHRSGINGKFTLYTDSQFWINMIYINMPNWVERKCKWESKKNSDLTKEIHTYHNRILFLPRVDLEIKYCQAWHDYTPNETNMKLWLGNKKAEELAEDVL
jgi:uracil-DNA glycosylase